MSNRIYFINYTNHENGIRSTGLKMFNLLKDLKKFITENLEAGISGYVTRQYYEGDYVTQSDYLGSFNGFKPSAQEGLHIEVVIQKYPDYSKEFNI